MRDAADHVGEFARALVSRREARLDALVAREIVDAGVAPCGVVAWARRVERGWRVAIGAAGTADDAIFDLASLTKPLTAIAAMRLVAAGALRRETTISALLPALGGRPAAHARLEDLLAHRAGLPPWGAIYRRDPFAEARPDAHAALEIASRSLPPNEPLAPLETLLQRAGSRLEPSAIGLAAAPTYSDLGYVLAGAMVARVAGSLVGEGWESISAATSAARWRARDVAFAERVQPTELVEWRGGEVRGEVHDENALAIERAGGEPGHAGAFGTALDVVLAAARFVDALRGSSPRDALLPPDLAEEMIAPRAIGSHRLGWDGVTAGASSSGTRFGARAFGHLGFTGTSVWADPDAQAIAVLLTNRTHPSRQNQRIRAARPRVHDALWAIEP